MHKLSLLIIAILQMASITAFAQQPGTTDAIYSGIPWFDNHGNIVSAHGGNIVKDKGKFYFFGEAHTDTSNAFAGFNCYSSSDLYNWKFEKIALPVQPSGKLGPNRIGERAKVIKNHKTGEFIMYMHVDTLGYKDQFIGYATAKKITGPYFFRGPLLYNGKPIRKWDMGVFQDHDQSGYLLIHGGEIYKLAEDYKSIVNLVNKAITSGFESPTLFRKNNLYYFIGSHLTSWEKNDNYYYTAESLGGPWTSRGLLAPVNKLTWNSQTTYVLPVAGSIDTAYLFMGDRWSFPKQASTATYVWQPIAIAGTQISISGFHPGWQLNTKTGIMADQKIGSQSIVPADNRIRYSGSWEDHTSTDGQYERRTGDIKASFSITFTGRRIGLYSYAAKENGYARITITDQKGQTIYHSTIDQYSNSPASSLVFLSPWLAHGQYTMKVSNTGERPNWSDKKKSQYGSTGNYISLEKIIINQ
jgi:hypothetical protein